MDKLPNKIDFNGFDVILIDAELLATKVKIPSTCNTPIVVMNSSRQIPAEITEQTIFLRRPVIEGCLFAAIAIEALKLHRASPDYLRSPKISISPSTGQASLTKKKKTQGAIQRMKILLVEDNRLVQQIAIRLLQKLGPLDVSVADNGFEAVEMFKKEHYDAIFMDCQMPVMDGFEATKRIRQLEQENQSSRTKIIALTAGVSEQLKKECLDAGMDSYIPKPVTLSMLRSALAPPDDEDSRCVENG
jgi:CheY-like chemotaxis protein